MKRITLSWGRTDPASCPRCQSTLRSATGISDRPVRPSTGDATLCDQCLTWLIFEQRLFPASTLTLRVATAIEVDSIDPELKAMAERCAAELATTEPKQ